MKTRSSLFVESDQWREKSVPAMGILSKILSKGKPREVRTVDREHKTFLDFLEQAAVEIDELIVENSNWYQELPYNAPMGPELARELEVEKRAIWRRVIYDAERSKLTGLRWESSKDARVCDECRKLEGRVFFFHEYEELNKIHMHIGCRCNLIPVRDPDEGKH